MDERRRWFLVKSELWIRVFHDLVTKVNRTSDFTGSKDMIGDMSSVGSEHQSTSSGGGG